MNKQKFKDLLEKGMPKPKFEPHLIAVVVDGVTLTVDFIMATSDEEAIAISRRKYQDMTPEEVWNSNPDHVKGILLLDQEDES